MIDFLCIGAQKSGTTLLYKQLKKIDKIFLPKKKELHFFDDIKNYNKGIESYLEYFKDAKEYQVKGEITPAYIFFDTVPRRIKQLLGNKQIKFIVILRNPIDRAYSQYNMSFSMQGHEKLSFEQALIYENYRLVEYADCVNFSYLKRGFYSHQVLNYFKYFKREQFKFILYEEFVKDQSKYIFEILQFLGLDINIKNLHIENEVVFQNKYKKMKAETRKVLNQIYKEEIDILENILQIDLNIWKEEYK